MDRLTGRIIEKLTALSSAQAKQREKTKEQIMETIRKNREAKKKKSQFRMRVTDEFTKDFNQTSKKLGLSKTQIAEETLKEVFHFLGVKHPKK